MKPKPKPIVESSRITVASLDSHVTMSFSTRTGMAMYLLHPQEARSLGKQLLMRADEVEAKRESQ